MEKQTVTRLTTPITPQVATVYGAHAICFVCQFLHNLASTIHREFLHNLASTIHRELNNIITTIMICKEPGCIACRFFSNGFASLQDKVGKSKQGWNQEHNPLKCKSTRRCDMNR